MLSEQEVNRVCVVLVRARNPANIGAVARAMHDFGVASLRVVNEFAVPFEAARSAVDAAAVMQNAAIYTNVADAVADCTLAIGTTAVGERDLQHPLYTLAEAVPQIRRELARPASSGPDKTHPRVALLFGSEKTGLSNDELSYCNWLLTIPMHHHAGVRHPSMNLGQAVAVCLYELVRGVEQGVARKNSPIDSPETSDSGTLERISALLLELMEKTEYMRRHAANSSPDHVRRLVRRMGADADDAPVWMGILRQALWKLGARED